VSKGYIYLCAGAGSLAGSYLPVLLGSSFFGGWSILGSLIGGIAGIWIGVKLSGGLW
jgi:hypothetical protein